MNRLSLIDCVKAVLTDRNDEVWKCPSRLANKLVKYGYTETDEINSACDLFYELNPIKYKYQKSKRDKVHNTSNWKSIEVFKMNLNKCVIRIIRSKSIKPISNPQELTPNPSEQTQEHAPICITPSLSSDVRDYVSEDKIVALGGKTHQKINMDNLNYVFSFCIMYGKKGSFFLSVNNHGLQSEVFSRNLKRLEVLGLIKCVKRGRQYNAKNIITETTNLASEFELLVNPIYKEKAPEGLGAISIDCRANQRGFQGVIKEVGSNVKL